MYLLGIDIGTTNWKAVVYDYAGNVMGISSRPAITHYGDSGRAVYHPDEVWHEICLVLQELLTQCKQRSSSFTPDMVTALAVTGMGESMVPLDKQNRVLYDAVAWFDPRTEPQYRQVIEQHDAYHLFSITGLPAAPLYSLNKMLWVKENEPDIFEKTHKWLTMTDFLLFKFSGEYATEYSEATRTMCFDIQAKRWSQKMLAILGVDASVFPTPSPSGTVIGTLSRQASRETGLAEGTGVVTGGHDHICGALAVGIFEEGRALDSCGTTETLLLSLERVPLTEEAFHQELVFGCHAARDTYYMLAALYTAGIIIRWFQEQLAPETLRSPKAYQQLIEEARQIPPGADGVFFLPHFRGSSSLPVDPLSRGTFVGILSHHTRAHLFRAIIEGLCYEIRNILNVMTSTSGIAVESLRVIGSARNDFWLQTKADILQLDLEIPDVTEGTCLGAALLSGIGTGVYRDERDAFTQTYRPGQAYHPNPEHTERYNRLYHEIFRSIYSTVVPLHHKIADVMRKE